MKSKGYRFTVWVLVLSLLVSGATAAAEGNGAIGAGTVSTLFSEEAFSTFLAAAEEGASINLPDSHDTFAFIYNMETESAWAMAWIVNDPMTMYVSYDYVQNEDGQNRITSIMLYHWDAEKGTNGLKLAFHEDGQPEYSMYKIDKIAGEDYDRPVTAVHFAEAEKEFRASPEAFEECWARAEDSGRELSRFVSCFDEEVLEKLGIPSKGKPPAEVILDNGDVYTLSAHRDNRIVWLIGDATVELGYTMNGKKIVGLSSVSLADFNEGTMIARGFREIINEAGEKTSEIFINDFSGEIPVSSIYPITAEQRLSMEREYRTDINSFDSLLEAIAME